MVLSPKIPHPPHPSEPAILSASNLELLATPHNENRVQEFVASQTRYFKARANEGRAVHTSWNITTPEKDKMRLYEPSAGFETPVLRPRAAQIARAEPGHRPASQPHSSSPANKPTPKSPGKAKSTSAIQDAVSPKRQKKPKNKPMTKSGTSYPARKERRARSDTDEEHLARLTERRERKRARREIMNPQHVKAGTRAEKENNDDAKNCPNDKKKRKLPAGLALMHGFASASVGKSRLTIEPPPNFGVFNKGRASAKIKVDESKHTKQIGFPSHIFSEDRFLNSKPPKSPEKHFRTSEVSSSGNTSCDQPSSPVRTKKPAAVLLRKTPIKVKRSIGRYPPAASPQNDDEIANSYASGAVCRRGAKPSDDSEAVSMKLGSPARSTSWVIEHDNISLPSTTSDVALVSVKSKPKTTLLDIRAAAWSRILKSNLHDEKAPSPPEHEKHRAISTIAAMTVPGAASNVHHELEELATIGPWESVSQVARSTLHTLEPRPVHSRYFALPDSDKSGLTQPVPRLANNNTLGQPPSAGSALSNRGGDTVIDEPFVYGEAGVNHQDGDLLPVTAPASASPAEKTFAFPEEGISVLLTSSLDSVDRVLLPDFPGVARGRLGSRKRSMQWREFKSTPEDMLLHQYGLDPIDKHGEVLRPLLHGHGDSEPADACNPLGDPATLYTMEDHSAPSFGREFYVEGFEGNSENQAGRSEYYPSVISDSPEFANQVTYIPTNASHGCQDGAQLFIDEDTEYERVTEIEGGCTGHDISSMQSADWNALLEGDADTATNIHLWSDEAWPRGETIGGNNLQEGCSHLTTVQKVEQDVAKKLKGHWFPHKF